MTIKKHISIFYICFSMLFVSINASDKNIFKLISTFFKFSNNTSINTKKIVLKYLKPKAVKYILEHIFFKTKSYEPINSLQYIIENETLYVTGDTNKIELIESFIKYFLDLPLDNSQCLIHVIKLNYIFPESTISTMKAITYDTPIECFKKFNIFKIKQEIIFKGVIIEKPSQLLFENISDIDNIIIISNHDDFIKLANIIKTCDYPLPPYSIGRCYMHTGRTLEIIQ